MTVSTKRTKCTVSRAQHDVDNKARDFYRRDYSAHILLSSYILLRTCVKRNSQFASQIVALSDRSSFVHRAISASLPKAEALLPFLQKNENVIRHGIVQDELHISCGIY